MIESWLYLLMPLLLGWFYFRYLGPIFVTYMLGPDAIAPTKAYHRAACYDLYASKSVPIPVGEWRMVPTGVSFAPWPHFYIPFLKLTITPFGNVAGKIYTRSGLALRRGIRAHLGIIDNDYRAAWDVMLYNHGTYPVRIKAGDRIAQIEFYRVPSVGIREVGKLSNSFRGDKGFGSSGQ